MAVGSAVEKQEFKNTTGGMLGVVTVNRRGETVAISLAPGDTVWLSEEEQIATANAPRDPQNNPFIAPWVHSNELGQEVDRGEVPRLERVTAVRPTGGPATSRPLGRQTPEETGAAPTAASPPPVGSFAAGEEVADADAPYGRKADGTPRKRRGRPPGSGVRRGTAVRPG